MLLAQLRSDSKKRIQPWRWQLSPAIGSTLVGIGIYIITARALGPSTFGIYTFVQWLASITVPILGVGMSALSSRQIVDVQGRETPPGVVGILYYLWYRQCRSIVLYGLLYLLLAFPLSWLFAICTPLRLLLTVLAMLPLFLSSVVGITLRSLHCVEVIGKLHLLGVLSTLLLVIVAAQTGSLEVFLLAFALSGTATLLMAVISLTRLLPMKEARPPAAHIKKRLDEGFKQSFSQFFFDAIIWQRSESLLLAYWHSPAEVGFYAISTMISSTLMRLTPMLLSSWVLPLLLPNNAGRRYVNEYDTFVKTSCYMAFLAVPICILTTVLAPYIIMHSLGPEYLPLIQPLRILLIASTFGSIAAVSVTYLTNRGEKNTWLNTGVASLHVVLVFPCVAYGGMTGAALATAIVQIISAVGSMLACRKMLLKGATPL